MTKAIDFARGPTVLPIVTLHVRPELGQHFRDGDFVGVGRVVRRVYGFGEILSVRQPLGDKLFISLLGSFGTVGTKVVVSPAERDDSLACGDGRTVDVLFSAFWPLR